MPMRNEEEMFELIRTVAREDERIRAAYLCGSRANPSAPRDRLMDYDVVYAVTETLPFIRERGWLLPFGKTLIVQEPDSNDMGWGLDADPQSGYAFLMLFEDGSRIDLTLRTVERAVAECGLDGMSVSLLDKDGLLVDLPAPTDERFLVKRPTEAQYRGCCNEFWWCLNNVAKGIARDELPYAMNMYDGYVRRMLERMLEWHIGADAGFSVSAGKLGKYFKRYLPADVYASYLATYTDACPDRMWEAVFVSCVLFERVARHVAGKLGFTFNCAERNGMITYLTRVKNGEL